MSVRGALTEVRGAVCERRGEFVTANFGTNYSNADAAQGHYVGLLIGTPPKSGEGAAVDATGAEVIVDGKRVSVSAAKDSAAISGLERGSTSTLEGAVTGTLSDGHPVRITFHCLVT